MPAAPGGANQTASGVPALSDGTVSASGATPSTAGSSAGTRSGSSTLSPTAFIRRSEDTVDPPTSLSAKVLAPRTSRSTSGIVPLPRAAAAIALGKIPIEADPSDPATHAFDDEEASVLAAYLSIPDGEKRRARKSTLPPPPPREFPIAENAEEVLTALPAPSRRGSLWSVRNLAIAGIAGAVVIVALVLALGGGDDTKPAARTVAESNADQRLPVGKQPDGSDHEAVVADVAGGSAETGSDEAEIEIEMLDTGSGAAATPTPTPASAPAPEPEPEPAPPATTTTPTLTPATPAATRPKVSKLRALLKDKEIVLEYDGRIGKNSAPASDQPAIAKARASHAAGTQRLNAGDYNGALDHYRRALSHYPAYVGAYRGMGLAYERRGDKSNALKALRMYVSIAPRATDVPALRQRIDALSK